MRRLVPVLLCALTLGACSAAPHAAPLPGARKINTVTGDISAACGELYQLSAFGPAPRHDVLTLQDSAAGAVHELAAIYTAHPEWRFDGVGLGKIVRQSRTMLRGCGLRAAAGQLQRETGLR